jgi:hypothetical protein
MTASHRLQDAPVPPAHAAYLATINRSISLAHVEEWRCAGGVNSAPLGRFRAAHWARVGHYAAIMLSLIRLSGLVMFNVLIRGGGG